MDISHSKHSQHTQQPQHPYNPYLHQDQHHCQCPLYTLQPLSPPTPKSSSCDSPNDPPASQDMFVALERLLLGISPFPPSIPNLAQPTCPSFDDQTMTKSSPSPSSSPEHVSSPVPSIVLNEQSLGVLEEYYSERKQQPCNQDGSIHSGSSISSPTSPFSNTSSSPIMAIDNSHDLPYWSPSTPAFQADHQWSNHSSPLIQPQQQSHQKSTSWGYSLFDQMDIPSGVCDLDNSMDFSNSQHTQALQQQRQQKQQMSPSHLSQLEYSDQPKYPSAHSHFNNNKTTVANSLGILPLNARRAARTPPRRRISSELSGIRTFESTAYRGHYTNRHNQNATASTFSSSPSSSNTGSTSGANTCANSGNTQTNNRTNPSTTSASNHGAATRSAPRSYPCPTCARPFPTRTQLKSHMAIHIDNFPFPCLYPGCDLHFKRKHDLRRHVDAKHALVKKYLCAGGCGEGFGRRDQMVRHLKRGTCGHYSLTE